MSKAENDKSMRTVLFAGVFSEETPRNKVLLKGLGSKNINVEKINSTNIVNKGEEHNMITSGSFYQILRLVSLYIIENMILLLYLFLNPNKVLKSDIVVLPSYGTFRIIPVKIVCILFQKKLVFDVHGSLFYGYVYGRGSFAPDSYRGRFLKILDISSIKMADSVIVFSDSMKNEFSNTLDVDKNKMDVVYTGTDAKRFQEATNYHSDKVTNITYWGNFIPFHGVPTICKAAKILEEDRNDFIINLIGEGEEKDRAERVSEELGLENVRFLGRLPEDEFLKKICKSDIAACIFGGSVYGDICITNKVIEAASLGKPIITRESEAVQEVFNNESISYVDPENPKQLADRISELIEDDDKRIDYGKKARHKYENELAPGKVAEKFVQSIFTD